MLKRNLHFYMDEACTRRFDQFHIDFNSSLTERTVSTFTAYVKNPELDDYEVFKVSHTNPEVAQNQRNLVGKN